MVDWLVALGIERAVRDRGRWDLQRRHTDRGRDRGRELAIAVVGIPKTIDNDIHFIDRSFGFETATAAAADAIRSAHSEATSALNGVGLVKAMGRHSGFIACHAALTCPDAKCCTMWSRKTRPMSLRRVLPLASVTGAPPLPLSTHSSCPAPSATTITACERCSSRRSRCCKNPPSPSSRNGTSGMSTKFASGQVSAAWQAMNPECRPITLTRPTPLSALVALAVRAADGVGGRGGGGLEAEAAIDEMDIVVDGLWNPRPPRWPAPGARSRPRSAWRRARSHRPPITNSASIPSATSRSTISRGSWPPRDVPRIVPPCW